MRDKLITLLQYLSSEERSKDIIETEYTNTLKSILGIDKMTVGIIGETQDLHFAGLGQVDSYWGEINLFYKTAQGRFFIKPKLIQQYLDWSADC